MEWIRFNVVMRSSKIEQLEIDKTKHFVDDMLLTFFCPYQKHTNVVIKAETVANHKTAIVSRSLSPPFKSQSQFTSSSSAFLLVVPSDFPVRFYASFH